MSFDALAPHYRWMECVLAGSKLQRCRTAFLPRVAYCREVLIVGEGNGRFLVECRRHLPEARITCVDASARMLALAEARLRRAGVQAGRVAFIHADALKWRPPTRAFDLVVTHFFLDCFRPDQLRSVVAGLAAAAQPQADWLLADFQVPSGGFRRWRALAIHRVMYLFFSLATRLPARCLTAPDASLAEQGFALRERRSSDWALLHTDWWGRAPAP